jgi:nucleoside-diphosphate-sugar epimerase
MKVLLTGHLGYIGRSVYDRLWLRGYNIQGIDLLEDLDITTCLLDYKVDLVIHLAGKSGVHMNQH